MRFNSKYGAIDRGPTAAADQQRHSLCSRPDAAQCAQQQTGEQVVDVPDDDAEMEAQQRKVEQAVDVQPVTAVDTIDQKPLDETQRGRRPVSAKAAPVQEGSLSRAVRVELERVRY